MTSTKVYVGNLPYSTTDQQLIALFEGANGLLNGSIITRGRLSLGFGFVDFATPENAALAVESVKGKKIGPFGRSVIAELARDRSVSSNDLPEDVREKTIVDGGERGRRGFGRGRGRNRGTRGGRGRGRGRGNRGGKSNRNFEGNENNENKEQTETNAEGRRRGTPRVKKPRAPREPGPPSKTTLHVANLPWSYNNEDLAQIFEGTKFKSVRVVEFRGKSRGYGFVEFENEADQLAALESKKDLEVEDKDKEKEKRKIKVSISTAHPAPTEGESVTTTTTAPQEK